MTALDLKMEIAQQVQSMPDSEQLLLRLLNYVKTLTKGEAIEEQLKGDSLRLWNRTVELASLQANWDGAEAAPMEKKVVNNVQKVIKAGTASDFKDWLLFPDDNGTLLLQLRSGEACVSVGTASYSFVYKKGDDVRTGERVRFSPSSVLKVIRDARA